MSDIILVQKSAVCTNSTSQSVETKCGNDEAAYELKHVLAIDETNPVNGIFLYVNWNGTKFLVDGAYTAGAVKAVTNTSSILVPPNATVGATFYGATLSDTLTLVLNGERRP